MKRASSFTQKLHLLALAEHVVDVLDALVGDPRDVQQAIRLRTDVHEGAKVQHGTDGARVLPIAFEDVQRVGSPIEFAVLRPR